LAVFLRAVDADAHARKVDLAVAGLELLTGVHDTIFAAGTVGELGSVRREVVVRQFPARSLVSRSFSRS